MHPFEIYKKGNNIIFIRSSMRWSYLIFGWNVIHSFINGRILLGTFILIGSVLSLLVSNISMFIIFQILTAFLAADIEFLILRCRRYKIVDIIYAKSQTEAMLKYYSNNIPILKSSKSFFKIGGQGGI